MRSIRTSFELLDTKLQHGTLGFVTLLDEDVAASHAFAVAQLDGWIPRSFL